MTKRYRNLHWNYMDILKALSGKQCVGGGELRYETGLASSEISIYTRDLQAIGAIEKISSDRCVIPQNKLTAKGKKMLHELTELNELIGEELTTNKTQTTKTNNKSVTDMKYRDNHGGKRIGKNKSLPMYIGIEGEQILSRYIKNGTALPYGNEGFDYIGVNGEKIDVKSACLRQTKYKSSTWQFLINQNKKASHFLLLALDNRTNMTPVHAWMIPGEIINRHISIGISNTEKSLNRFKEYEILPIEGDA